MGLAEWYDRVAARLYTHAATRAAGVCSSLIIGMALLAYGAGCICTEGGILVLRRYNSYWIYGGAAWLAFAGIVCTGFACLGFALALRARGDEHQGYRRFRRWTMRAGLVLYGAGLFLGAFTGR
jgi:hypothetical protein